MEHRERVDDLLLLGVDQPAVAVGPGAAVQEEPVHVDALLGRGAEGLDLLARALRLHDDVVQRPLVLGLRVRARDLLQRGGEEALGVEEAREPVGLGPAVVEPPAELLVAVDEAREPRSHARRLPGHPDPHGRDAAVVEGVEGLDEVRGEDDGARDGQAEVLERLARQVDDDVEPVDLLAQVHGERLALAQLRDLLDHVLPLEHGRHLLEPVLAEAVHLVLPRLPARPAARLGHRVDDRVDHVVDLDRAEGQVRVRVQAEDLRAVLGREELDGGAEGLDFRGVRDHVAEPCLDVLEQLVADGHGGLVEVPVGVRVHQELVEVVRDAPAVHDDRDHVPHRLPGGLRGLLALHLQQVVLEELDARGQVRLVELVGNVPADGAELAALLHDRVHVAHDVQQLAPLLPRHGLQHVLGHPLVARPHAGLDAHGRLRRDLDRQLQQADREPIRGLRGDPEAELGVELVQLLDQQLLDLAEVLQAQVRVL